MAIRALNKTTKKDEVIIEKKLNDFIEQGGTEPNKKTNTTTDHRLTLRIPTALMDVIDKMRCDRLGKISRNLMILEIIEAYAKKKGIIFKL